MNIFLALCGVFLILVLSERLWNKKIIEGEVARKFVHVTVGSFIALWPYFMSWQAIQVISMVFLAVVLLSWKYNIFSSVHGIERRTWGEVFFPLGIGLSALLEPSNIVFTAAILHLSLADGFAAIIGTRYGKLRSYSIRNYTKTLIGSLTFWAISVCIVSVAVLVGNIEFPGSVFWLILLLPVLTTLVENVGVMGSDNVLLPLLVIAMLDMLPRIT